MLASMARSMADLTAFSIVCSVSLSATGMLARQLTFIASMRALLMHLLRAVDYGCRDVCCLCVHMAILSYDS